MADECLDNDIIRGLLRRSPSFDLVRAQDIFEVARSAMTRLCSPGPPGMSA